MVGHYVYGTIYKIGRKLSSLNRNKNLVFLHQEVVFSHEAGGGWRILIVSGSSVAGE